MLGTKAKTLDAKQLAEKAAEWLEEHPNDAFADPVDARDYALISIAQSLVTIAAKLK